MGKEATVRSFSGVKLLIIDEASRVEDQLYMSIRPMLAVSNGRIIALSTPAGMRGWFYEAYKDRRKWEYYEVPATECPRISPEFLLEEKENIGEYWMMQEYFCKFNESETSAFRREDIEAIIKPGLEQWDLDVPVRRSQPYQLTSPVEQWDL